jgi:DNA helicase-2/ATP-dependent DNA helicase PcrA
MEYVADFHIHSRFSRSTSQQMDLVTLNRWAQLKGVKVLGTGDFTHPQWFSELRTGLIPAEPGLFRLKAEKEGLKEPVIPLSCASEVRFLLSAEISTIYKKGEKVRKVHHLVLMPDLPSAARLNAKLERVGNIKSDGRPILGLDSRTLVQMILDASEEAAVIPAHAWTPHFSVLGARSGFDTIAECYEEFTPFIFAIETGLSSDPPMNWRLSMLDQVVLVSNSDAHSPSRLAREANVFDTELSFAAMVKALKTKDHRAFKGTIEFFPEEGKYHYDGHRACKKRMTPQETLKNRYRCPVCNRKVTVGVMHRVLELADRAEDQPPENTFPFQRLIPLVEILAETFKTGVTSQKVTQAYFKLLSELGSELYILRRASLKDIEKASSELTAEAVRRIREGKVHIAPGYDGEYGTIRVFEPGERQEFGSQMSLFSL